MLQKVFSLTLEVIFSWYDIIIVRWSAVIIPYSTTSQAMGFQQDPLKADTDIYRFS